METKKYKSVVVKVGSNVLTQADGALDLARLASLTAQVVELRANGIDVVLVSSGAVASGRSHLPSVGRKLDSISERQLFSAVGQAKLINNYYHFFGQHGVICGQVLTTKESLSSRGHYLNQQHCIRTMLECGVVPIVNENDTISITELMFTDNDELSGMVATMMGVDALIILSNIDGLYDGDPSDPSSSLIARVDNSSSEINSTRLSEFITPSTSQFGRGGMLTKCRISSRVADEGIEVVIANGTTPNILQRLLLDSHDDVVATRFIASARPVSGVKRWIAHSDGFAKGKVLLDENALVALLSPKAVSLLPVGVVAIEGEFEKNDIVIVASHEGTPVGVGRISVSSSEARQMAGVRGLKPIIHYDYLYIEE